MTTAELLTHLRKLNVALSGDNGQLILRGPKGALTADLRAELKARKAEILDFLKSTAHGQTPPDSSLRCVSRDRDLPLSFAQQRLWFLDQLEPGSTVYNVPRALRIEGPLSVEVLERCFNEIVRRHEALRTTFSTIEEAPVQVIAASTNVSLPVIDISRLSEAEREEEARRLALEEASKPFDLRQGPLFRTALIRLGENDHILLVSLHHIVSDGWSMGVLYRELSALYQAFVSEEPSPLADLPIQYVDFAAWQREWLQGEVLETQLSYWKKQLEEAPAVLNLPTDRPRPARQSYRGARQSIELSSELTRGLKALSRKEGVTLYMTLLAAFQILLHRHTGQDDIVVGSPIANRNRIEIEGLIGFFVNTLVLRTDHSGNPTFRELLRKVRETALEAYAHQDLPFEKLVEELRPDRDLSRSPLFQVMFILQNAPAGALNCQGLNVSPMRMGGETTKFDLTLSVHEGGPGLRAALQYSTDLFDEATIARMLGHFEILLEGIVANPEQSLSDVPILSEAEKHQLLVEWNETKRDYPKDKCIHQLFEEQVERTPEAVAVVFEEQELTYRELNRRANQLAHYLRKLGVGPEALVGICVERSIEMIVGLLGILKAGGAYVPLDPSYPKERIRFMLDDAQASVLLIQQQVRDRLPDHKVPIVSMDKDREQIAQQSDLNPITTVTVQELAYVIYTSGTTGTPKGVMINHRSLVNYLCWFNKSPLVKTVQSLPVISRPAFDASLKQLFAPLLRGDRVWIPSDEVVNQPVALLEALTTRTMVGLNCVPSLWRAVLDNLNSAHAAALAKSLSSLFLGGERLDQHSVDLTFASMPHIEIWNLYGPTEATANACTGIITPHSALTIGRPIANTQVYILDGNLQPVPVGVTGELYIGGVGLARGYLHQPDLTQEKFIRSPFSSDSSLRLYRTGDLARYLPDGNIEFLGRTDTQVKIRGYRVELSEIEVTVEQHPWVREAVVIVREDVAGNKRLVAYIIARPAQHLIPQQLRDYLKEKLPEYMIPNVFVFLDSLPLTASGKIDRRALPAPDGSRPEMAEAYTAPRSVTEKLLAKIWAEVLKLEKVGIHDNFFDLGGHSLLATQAVSRMRDALRKNIPLRNLFEAPTISALALLIEKSNDSHEALHAPAIVAELADRIEKIQHYDQRLLSRPIVPISRAKSLPLSFSQQRLWFLDQYEPNSPLYNIPSALRLKGELNERALEQSLAEIVRRHESLRTTFSQIKGEPIQVISASIQWSLVLVDLTNSLEVDKEREAERLVREEARRPFDLGKGPLFRATLIRLGRQDNLLLLTLHHIVSDGWSMAVLQRELKVLYEAFVHDRPSPLPELAIQYADFAAWQRGWFQGEVLDQQLAYWKKQLEGIPAMLNLPTDRSRPAVQSFRGKRESLVFSKNLTDKLKALSRSHDSTLFMTLLAAFQTLLYRYTGQEDIVVGSPIANRTRTETEGLIGFFINTLVLRTNLSGNPTFREVLTRVRKVTLDAYAHQDIPFEKLIEELRPERDLSRSPLFQVFFNMVNVGETRFEFFGVEGERLSIGDPGSKFDLTMYVREQETRIHLSLVYNADLFEPVRMLETLRQYEKLLIQVTENPDRGISAYSLLTHHAQKTLPDPTQTLGSDWFGAVHERFSQNAQSAPDQIAVSDSNDSWTYGELNARSNQLANYLLASGIRRKDTIAIYAHRSAPLVCAVLGVLKAGGAFLILDPAYPPARLMAYVKAANPWGIIRLESAGAMAKELEECTRTIRCHVTLAKQGAPVVENSFAEWSREDPQVPAHPDDLACISFTSGSKGVPKGILGRHGPLSHFIPWQQTRFSLGSTDRFSLLSGLSHDPLQREMFTPLWIGATICVPDTEAIANPGELARWMGAQKITFAHLTPALGRLLTETAPTGCQLPDLRYAFVVGEKLTWGDVSGVRRLAPGVTCVNYYGSTETQRAVSFYEVPPDANAESVKAVVSIGRGMSDVQLLILNDTRALAGTGEVGEIYLRSPHLAEGYLDDASLTKERFVVNPLSAHEGDRLYKTGDLGRYRPDGNAEILGRIDEQISIRGFRIEPAEIEAILAQHSEVSEAVISASENVSAEKFLVGYIVPRRDAVVSKLELRSFLHKKLPRYMIPSDFVILASLPLTPNGKVDYRALPAPDHKEPREHQYVAPQDDTERRLARIWSEVLGVNRIGIDDEFFAIGGHSLLASKLFARLDEEFGRSPPVAVLFAAPTIRLLAEHYCDPKESGQSQALIALRSEGHLPPLYAVPGVYGSVVGYTSLLQALGPEQPFYGLQSIGLEGAEPPLESIEEIAKRYISEILVVQPRGPYAIVGACFGATVAYEMARQLLEEGKEVTFLGLLDPTHREGFETIESMFTAPNVIKRTKVLGIFFRRRMRLYLNELKSLRNGERIRFITKKLNTLSSRIGRRDGYRGVRREFYQLEVVRANVRALDRYRRKPLKGRLKVVEIFESSHPRNTTAWNFDWETMWDGRPVRHQVPGKDSADLVSGKNTQVLARLLSGRLREAFVHSSEESDARN